jgi:transcriptional regulator with XRE-family HTH domain
MIGERLLELRRDADLTQDDLAAILNINKHSISSYERDKSEPPDAIKAIIARYFNVSLDYLVGLTDYPIPLEMEKRAIRLPDGFRKEYLPELMGYIDYLVYKGNKKEG